jgi:hypothetical protein
MILALTVFDAVSALGTADVYQVVDTTTMTATNQVRLLGLHM